MTCTDYDLSLVCDSRVEVQSVDGRPPTALESVPPWDRPASQLTRTLARVLRWTLGLALAADIVASFAYAPRSQWEKGTVRFGVTVAVMVGLIGALVVLKLVVKRFPHHTGRMLIAWAAITLAISVPLAAAGFALGRSQVHPHEGAECHGDPPPGYVCR